ncbi:MAG: phosphate transport system regulatory protein PhoU [Chloroflexi bacterium UTCFX4]|nr:MAG: phosphate transport system regulatory protein PhoU [Chloroflexi bacterium UTCFX4]
MPRDLFERELEQLQNEMLTMAHAVENALTDAVAILAQRDMEGARALIARDRAINQQRFDLEAQCLVVVATQQPMASDLRIVAAILFNVNELERIGDYAKGIAKINLRIPPEPLLQPLADLPRMAEITRAMLHSALDAFVRRDVALARAIPRQDDAVDALFEKVNQDLLQLIIADSRVTAQANLLMWAAHNLERAADRVTNLCERAIFTVTGEFVEMDADEPGQTD